MPSHNSGGATTMNTRKFIGKHGGNYASQKEEVVWVSEIYTALTLQCLQKQVRRLLSDPDSLSARVMRARYYPDGKLLNAKLKSGSSYTWQSVLAGLECFKYMACGGWNPDKHMGGQFGFHQAII